MELQRLRSTTGAFRWGFFVPLENTPQPHLLAFLRVGHGYGHRMHRHSYLVLANLSPDTTLIVLLTDLFERHSAQLTERLGAICDCALHSVAFRPVNGSTSAKADSTGNRLQFARLPHPEFISGMWIDPRRSLLLAPTQLLVVHLDLIIQ